MNPFRLAVASTVLLMLCGTAGAETMDRSKDDPLAVPVSAKDTVAKRDAKPWTAERQAKAQPKAAPDVDPAAVRAASARFRDGRDGGPAAATAPLVVATGAAAPIGAAGPGADDAGDYWTPERLRKAKPMPMPELPAKDFDTLSGPGKKNR